LPPLPWLDMCCLSIIGVGRVRELGLLVVRVAKLVVVALVIVGIDELVREEGVVHSVFHFARFSPHARASRRMAVQVLGPGLSHKSGRMSNAPPNIG
jgi:hypothetical protein